MSSPFSTVMLVVLVALIAWSVFRLLTRRHHPWHIFVQAATMAFFLWIMATSGILPAVAAWLWWPVIVVMASAVAYACIKAMSPVPAECADAPEGARATETRAPKAWSVAAYGVLALLVAAAALLGG